MNESIVFIHGMFQNATSWDAWAAFFRERGYNCFVKSWPLHDGDPTDLRNNPPQGLGDLRFQSVVSRYAELILSFDTKPIAIGHSVGGLIVQKLAERGIIQRGVSIASVAPNRMLAFDWGFFRNSVEITNPFVGDSIFEMTKEGFHKNFANTLSEADSNLAFERTATHDSRNILRDCMLDPGQIELELVKVPLLFVAAENDQIIPPELCEKNARAYDDLGKTVSYVMFPNRGHFICGEPKWEEVAVHVGDWLKATNDLVAATEPPSNSHTSHSVA